MAWVSLVAGQVPGLSSTQPPRPHTPAIPDRVLEFHAGDPVSGLPLSSTFATTFPFHASGNLILLEALSASDGTSLSGTTLYAIQNRDALPVNFSAISGLEHIELIGSFVSDRTIDVLVQATRPAETADIPANASPHAWLHHLRRFIVEFDHQAQFQRLIELHAAFDPQSLATLPSGDFLVSGYDRANKVQHLAMFDHTGELVRSFDPPMAAIADRSDLAGYLSAGQTKFTNGKAGVLAYRVSTRDPVLEIGPGGTVREVSLALPPGTVIQALVPSSDQWIVQVAREGTIKANAPIDPDNLAYFEVSPLDGSLLDHLVFTGLPSADVACNQAGTFIALRPGKTGLTKYTAH